MNLYDLRFLFVFALLLAVYGCGAKIQKVFTLEDVQQKFPTREGFSSEIEPRLKMLEESMDLKEAALKLDVQFSPGRYIPAYHAPQCAYIGLDDVDSYTLSYEEKENGTIEVTRREGYGYVDAGRFYKRAVVTYWERMRVERRPCNGCPSWLKAKEKVFLDAEVVEVEWLPDINLYEAPFWEPWMGDYTLKRKLFRTNYMKFQREHFTHPKFFAEVEDLLREVEIGMDWEDFERTMRGIYYAIRGWGRYGHFKHWSGWIHTLFMPGFLNVDHYKRGDEWLVMGFGYQEAGVEVPKYCVRIENAKVVSVIPYSAECFPEKGKTFFQRHLK